MMMNAQKNPLEAFYTVIMTVNGVEYAVKIQPERHFKMAVLQAVQIRRDPSGPQFELITSGRILCALLDLLVLQCNAA